MNSSSWKRVAVVGAVVILIAGTGVGIAVASGEDAESYDAGNARDHRYSPPIIAAAISQSTASDVTK